MADANIWGVVIGGLIGIAGGVVGPTILHSMQAKEREQRLRADKLQELAASVSESQVWLDNVRESKLFNKKVEPGVSPIAKTYAITTIYFPQLLTKVNELQQAAQSHIQWIAAQALKYAEDPTVDITTRLQDNYKPYFDKLQEMITEINRTAALEFRARNTPPFDRVRDQWAAAFSAICRRMRQH
jgi:hypothetical protein